MSTFPADYDSDPGRFLSNDEWPHDDVHPYVAERFAAAGVRRGSRPVHALSLDLPMTLTMRGCLVYATKGQVDGSSP